MRTGPWVTMLALLVAGCPEAPVRPPPPPPEVAPPPPLAHVPPGCEANLSGLYAHRDDQTFHYELADDGARLHFHAFRQYGATPSQLPSGTEIDLNRTSTGIHGEAPATVLNRLHQPCPVRFPYELTACSADGLTLRTAQRLELGDDCQIQDAIHQALVETVLLRIPNPDAGTARSVGALPGIPSTPPDAG